jgi:hypothetical protein
LFGAWTCIAIQNNPDAETVDEWARQIAEAAASPFALIGYAEYAWEKGEHVRALLLYLKAIERKPDLHRATGGSPESPVEFTTLGQIRFAAEEYRRRGRGAGSS